MARGLFAVLFALGMSSALVAQTSPQAPASRSSDQPVQSPHILCGMRVFPADPTIDARMAKPIPPGTFTLDVAQPRTCRNSFASLAPSASELKQRLPQIFGPKR